MTYLLRLILVLLSCAAVLSLACQWAGCSA